MAQHAGQDRAGTAREDPRRRSRTTSRSSSSTAIAAPAASIDRLLAEEGIERLEGPHCYAFFSGNRNFEKHADEDVTAFFLTDYLARHFDKLIWEGLGMDRHPELLPLYFGNYTKIVFLAQTRNEELAKKAMDAAKRLGLAYEYRFTGYGELERDLKARAETATMSIKGIRHMPS